MGIIGMLLMVVGGIAMVAGGLWLLVVIFQESVLWGIGSLLFGPISLIFVILNWEISKKPFLVNLGGAAVFFLGTMLGGAGLQG